MINVLTSYKEYLGHLSLMANWDCVKTSSYEDKYKLWDSLCYQAMGTANYLQETHQLTFEEVAPVFENFRDNLRKVLLDF